MVWLLFYYIFSEERLLKEALIEEGRGRSTLPVMYLEEL
jgi:hypothetical protein